MAVEKFHFDLRTQALLTPDEIFSQWVGTPPLLDDVIREIQSYSNVWDFAKEFCFFESNTHPFPVLTINGVRVWLPNGQANTHHEIIP